jgi:hypothetical protein
MSESLAHTWNSWLSRTDVDWAYVRINRTGSSWLANYLKSNDFETGNPRALRNHHKLVVLREPLERFISGICFHDGLVNKFISQPRQVLIRYEDDPHIYPQVNFLKDVDVSNCTFIKYSPTWVSNFSQFLIEYNTSMHTAPSTEWFNKPKFEDADEITLVDENIKNRFILAELYKEDPFMQKLINQHLEKDYKLYNKVKWYGTN